MISDPTFSDTIYGNTLNDQNQQPSRQHHHQEWRVEYSVMIYRRHVKLILRKKNFETENIILIIF